jgi:hypothetical protein
MKNQLILILSLLTTCVSCSGPLVPAKRNLYVTPSPEMLREWKSEFFAAIEDLNEQIGCEAVIAVPEGGVPFGIKELESNKCGVAYTWFRGWPIFETVPRSAWLSSTLGDAVRAFYVIQHEIGHLMGLAPDGARPPRREKKHHVRIQLWYGFCGFDEHADDSRVPAEETASEVLRRSR